MNRKIGYSWLLLLLALASLFPVTACTGASAQDIQGLLQAIDGKDIVVTLADGTTARITVQDDKLAAKARDLVGKSVDVKVGADDRRMLGVERLGEDDKVVGVIDSIGNGTVVIAGQTFKVMGNTRIEGGIVAGALARIEFVKLADGTFQAVEIQADKDNDKLTGPVQSLTQNSIVVGGKTFQINPATRVEDVAAGVVARVEFVTMPDGSMVAIEVEPAQAADRLTGEVEAVRSDAVVVDGKTVKINSSTRFERGVDDGAQVRVRFVQLSDGSLLATRIDVDKSGREVRAEQENQKREAEIRGREQEIQRRENELRGREQELQKHEQEVRGRENELRGREQEVQRHEDEIRGREAELRGRAQEGEPSKSSSSGQEAEAGRGGAGEVGRGGGDSGGSSGGSGGGGSSGGDSGSGGGGGGGK